MYNPIEVPSGVVVSWSVNEEYGMDEALKSLLNLLRNQYSQEMVS